ncbi:MAG: hypothetical protein R6V54_06090 [Desulfobacteraceae bacterium]
MYEIIANPKDYNLDNLIEGTGNAKIEFSSEEREKWASEINSFSEKIIRFGEKSQELAKLFSGSEPISTTPASIKTLKIQLFTINDALSKAMEIAEKLESDIVPK